MINLLPPTTKENILYARRNTVLLHWVVALFGAMLGIAFIVIAGQIYLSNVSKNLNAQVAQGQADLQSQEVSQTQDKVEEISNSLKLALQVLSRQVLFSKLLQQVGSVMPKGAALTDLSITATQGGIDLQADAINHQTATQVQVNLQDPENKIFSKADIVTINCDETDKDGYPCSITIRAQFAENNNFTLLPSTTSGAAR